MISKDEVKKVAHLSRVSLKENEIEYVDFHSTRPGHDLRYALSGEKLKKMGFRYTMPFEKSFEKMVKWMIRPENLRWLNL